MSDLGFENKGIAEAIQLHRFVVPVNQRSYTWEEEHVEDLFTDLDTARTNGDSEYFLGTMVFTQKPHAELEVADGQQRLATTVMLLAAFRDFLHNDPTQKRLMDSIRIKYLASYDDQTDAMLPQLTLNTEDNDFFRDRIIADPDAPERLKVVTGPQLSHARIETAAKTAAKWVRKITDTQDSAQKINNIKGWLTYLREAARIILVTVQDPGKAFKIFETLNDRGLKLSQVDLLKNHLYGQASVGKRFNEAQKRWDEMVGALEASGYEDLSLDYIRQLWISYHGHIKVAQLYDSIKEYTKSPDAAITFAGELSGNVVYFMSLLNPRHPVWRQKHTQGTARCIDVMINSLRVDRIRPLLLSILAMFNKRDTERCFRLCVSWTVRYLIVGGIGSGTVEKFYANAAEKIRTGKIANPEALAAEMKKHVPANDVFENKFATASVARSYLARYYFRALELQRRGEKDAALASDDDAERYDLEHIMPEKPSKEWNVKEDETKRLVGRIGNLGLLEKPINSAIKGKGIQEKELAYKKSTKLTMNTISAGGKWGSEEIDQRQKELAALAVKAWPITV